MTATTMLPRPGPAPRTTRSGHGRRPRGVTLLELMIVVVVVALLAAVAVPGYQNSVRKARRTEAKMALTACAQRLERHYSERNAYTDATVTLCDADRTSSYELQLEVSGSNMYVLAAEPKGAQYGDACGTFTLSQDGRRGLRDSRSLTADDCW